MAGWSTEQLWRLIGLLTWHKIHVGSWSRRGQSNEVNSSSTASVVCQSRSLTSTLARPACSFLFLFSWKFALHILMCCELHQQSNSLLRWWELAFHSSRYEMAWRKRIWWGGGKICRELKWDFRQNTQSFFYLFDSVKPLVGGSHSGQDL